ncbi:MAG: heme ABC exporter ATP-binding protein CcmA [Gemmatimonadetes bacterium]|nr:heme ABC exporter ATP-binding protein CcmA [Gemmatimonadota bacterium]MCA9761674.1 heme ABC exporter ATP-binding protein CcmA [Gemmatimonadota bacterium]MCB9505442.1 heme ABC exporter ATP-binding protein CcmA [Gemmatimonadales bacterium]MCB9518716.1 heme ABC exporter ATP-binding protein CcmA [Gemmatimonadales bacterium]HRX20044.1 heme ABC exporter ATP-binding protein CcmA [Gemmatimonadales bacterium]
MTADPLIEATGLVRRFGMVRALAGVDFRATAGEMVLLLGPNGAGKTTLLRILAGLVRPLRGTVRIAGADVHRDPGARAALGFVSHHAMVYDDLTPRENLRFHAALHGLDAAEREIDRALAAAGLSARADAPARGFSRGMLQRLSLARAALHDPVVLLLDEPFTGLDPLAAGELRGRIGDWRARDRAIVAVTHDPAELWELASRVVVLRGGTVVHDSPHPGDLQAFRTTLSGLLAA